MIDPELLELLCCPDTLQALRPATSDELALASREGTLNRAGRAPERPVTAGLIREDGALLYPIWDAIPCLLIEEGIALASTSAASR